jgi:hypothetical protein
MTEELGQRNRKTLTACQRNERTNASRSPPLDLGDQGTAFGVLENPIPGGDAGRAHSADARGDLM